MSKLVSLASFAALALTAGLAHAEPPCPGSNGNGCSWTCTGSTYHVTCQNTSVGGLIPRCYDVTGSNVTTVPCDIAPPSDGDEIDAAFELILELEDGISALEDGAGVCYEPTKEKTADEGLAGAH
jgi:hypothetical protein